MIIKSTESKAHPLMTSPKKKISSLMSIQARGIMNISIISDSRIVSNVFIIFYLYLLMQIYEISFEKTNLFLIEFCSDEGEPGRWYNLS